MAALDKKGSFKKMRKEDFYFDLPEELIAQDPLEDRSSSRLLVLDKETGKVEHHVFREIIDYLQEGDCLVINDTKVIPARLIGSKIGTDAKIEVLLLKRKENDVWETLVKPGKKAKVGTRISFGDGLLVGEVVDIVEEGNRLIHFEYEGIFEEILDQLGQMPLPPYIKREDTKDDRGTYQTVYARDDKAGSVAAPTAGLHFTPELRAQMASAGVEWAEVTLHVGYGTFSPVRCEDIREHVMHEEFVEVPQATVDAIGKAKAEGRLVIAVGTTSARTLEGVAGAHGGELTAHQGWINCFIWPGYSFHVLDGLITNFHLPESTLLMLVSALTGRERMLETYTEAVKMEYRFFSYGDAMLIR